MRYQQALRDGTAQLLECGITEASNDAWLLLSYVTGMNRTSYYMHMTDEMPVDIEAAYLAVLTRRSARIPLQHITGEQDFMGLPFKVNSHVLVPRQDTELLAEEALRLVRDGMEVLDMCTGSGCIIISVKKNCPGIRAVGADISSEALAVARENAVRNQTDVTFLETDLFEKVEGRFDMILSNPPYIPSAVIPTLMPEVARFEPIGALDGKEDGLYFYRIITEEAKNYLNEHGKLLLEIGNDQGKDVSEMMTRAGYRNVRVMKDLAANDRLVTGEL